MQLSSDKECQVPIDGGTLFCRIFGKKMPSVVVLHGGPGIGHNYLLPQMAKLGHFSSTLFYDQRGTGQSSSSLDTWQSNPFQTYVHDLDQLRQTLGLEKITLLAHSWGGMLASLYALAYPEHVDRIIYLNTVPLSSENYLAFVKHRSQLVNAKKDELTSLRKAVIVSQGDPTITEKYYRLYFSNYFTKPERSQELTLKMSPEAAINNFKIYDLFYDHLQKHPFDLYERLKVLNKPSLIIACDEDVVPLHYMEQLRETIPASEFVLLQDCGHFPYIDQPDALFEVLQRYLNHA